MSPSFTPDIVQAWSALAASILKVKYILNHRCFNVVNDVETC